MMAITASMRVALKQLLATLPGFMLLEFFCFFFSLWFFFFLISGHSLQKIVEINLNKQNRFAENKTRTPPLLQSACFQKACETG